MKKRQAKKLIKAYFLTEYTSNVYQVLRAAEQFPELHIKYRELWKASFKPERVPQHLQGRQ